ncbi:long-chain acyl-CoA synthetase [Asanoa ishikariensis]|uniref:Long-chain acyl-CoA synthetase n=1 Tax=Asanoa ishikariensis TaxID=137265 RepID=A0A1H3QLC2_9ACTN|nr:long-chain acyl-CoA synthetase [Asanoa ishikariensis]SDZ13838.1 long-chain acyl-CoA synthetase [Asanoa ishikariensis]
MATVGDTVPDSATVVDHRSDTLADRVAAAAAATPDKTALIWHDTSLRWGELDRRVDAAAAALTGLNLPAGARVALALPNSPRYAVTFFAVLRAGLVAVPVNPQYTARELRHVLADSGASLLVASPDVARVVEGIRGDLPELARVLEKLPEEGPAGSVAATNDLAVLLYTSGTEGAPKGAMLSHRALLANHAQIDGITPTVVGPDDILLLALPLFHAYGLNSGLGAVAYHGATGVLVDRFDPADSLALIARHGVTGLVGVPSMYQAWSLVPDAGAALTTVRVAVCGAAPLDPETATRFTRATSLPVFVGYGLTETAPAVTSTLLSPEPKLGSIGRAIPGVELRLVAPDGSAVSDVSDLDSDEFDLELGPPETDPGEIVVRGANLFDGYWPDGRDGPDADGWWATGDIAYADADGDLFIVDRRGELIIVNGFNVYPREVEQVLEAHPGVAEAAVIGVPHPYTGQTVKAFVVRAPGTEVDPDELLSHAEANLARFKTPTALEFVAELPHSAIGKVRKAELRDV